MLGLEQARARRACERAGRSEARGRNAAPGPGRAPADGARRCLRRRELDRRGVQAVPRRPHAAPSGASQAAATATAAHDVLVAVLNQTPLTATSTQPIRDTIVARLRRARRLRSTRRDGSRRGADVADGIEAGAGRGSRDDRRAPGDGRWGPFRFTCSNGPERGDRSTNVVHDARRARADPFAWVAKVDPFVVEGNRQFQSKGPPALNDRRSTPRTTTR